MSKKFNPLVVWIPVICTFMTCMTTLGVAWINTSKKAVKMNEQRSQAVQRTLKPNEMFTVKASVKRGFYVSTNESK